MGMTARSAKAPRTPEQPTPKALISPARASWPAQVTVSPPFAARFAKPCGACGSTIAYGESARIISNEARGVRTVVHDRCVPTDMRDRAKGAQTLADVLG